MKKLLLATAFAAMFAGNAMAADTNGVVHFRGKVVEQTCTIAAGSQEQTVVLDTVQKTRFTNAGDTAMPTPFSIELQNCTTGTTGTHAQKVKARFASAANVDTQKDYTLKNKATTDPAQNVHIQLFNANGTTAIYPMKRSTSDTPPIHEAADGAQWVEIGTNATPTLNYIAKYYATEENVGVGNVESSVDFELTYE